MTAMILDLTAGSGLWLVTAPADLTAEVPVGPRLVRVSLGRIDCGLLPAVDAGPSSPGLRLTARVPEGTARPVAFDSHEAADALKPEAADRWVEGFGRALAGLVPAGPRIDAALAPGEHRRVAPPQALASRRGVCWLLTDEPCLAGFGIASARGGLAVTPDAWAQATGSGSVRAAASRFLWAGGGLPDALMATQQAWVAALPALIALAEVDRHQARRSRHVRARALLSAAERQATGGRDFAGEENQVEEPALTVAAELAHRLDLPLRVPPKRLRRTADQPYGLSELALASGFRLRRVTEAEAGGAAGNLPALLVLEGKGSTRILSGAAAHPADGGVLWTPVLPLKSHQLTPRALLPLLRHGRDGVRAALLDRLMRIPAGRLRECEAGRWVAWLDRLEDAANDLSRDLLRLATGGMTAVAALAALTVLAGWSALPAAIAGCLLAAFGGTGRDATREAGDPATLAALERLPKVRSMAARRWVLLGWYQSRRTGFRSSASLPAALPAALRSAALGAAPLLGAACAPATPWLAAGAATIGVLAGGNALAAGWRLARTLNAPTIPGVPATSFDLDAAEAPQRSDPGGLAGQIAVVGLSVRRRDEERWLFADLALSIAPGEFVALVGPSGCGKTTLLSILLGLHTPSAGAVFYDGYDLRSLEPAVLTRSVASVGQRDRLRPGTVREMLGAGQTVPQERLWTALAAVGLEDMVAALPGRLDTRLTLGESSMSRGQAQRLLLARALLAPATILILDEPTAALDATAEAQVVRAVRRSPATRIVATHREAVVKAADRVIDLTTLGGSRSH